MSSADLKIEWSDSTFLFYLGIIIGCYIVSSALKNKVAVIHIKYNVRISLWVFVSALLLGFVKGFGTTGRDLNEGYLFDFKSATSLSGFRDQSIEIGYRILNVVIRFFTDQYWVFVLIVSVLTLYPVIRMLMKYSDRIDVPAALLLYSSVYFFNGFSLVRISLSAALALFAFDSLIEEKPIKTLIWIMIAASIHVTALVFIIPFFLSFMKKIDGRLILLALLVFFLEIYFNREGISRWIFGSGRYRIYGTFEHVRIGFEQFVYYAPLFYLFFAVRKKDLNRQFMRVSLAFLSSGACFALLGYIFSVFGRFQQMFLPLIIIIPYYSRLYKEQYPAREKLVNTIVLAYCISRFVIYITQYYNMEDLMPYTNIFGWSI